MQAINGVLAAITTGLGRIASLFFCQRSFTLLWDVQVSHNQKHFTEMECLGISSSRKQLLPGILDDITLGHIVPKLPWRAFDGLSSVSRQWQAAIRTRKVYRARVASDSTEALVVFNYAYSRFDFALALYSPADNVYHRLPPIPDCFCFGSSWGCQFIALDGNLYVLGGSQRCLNSHYDHSSAEVYVLDIAGQRQWKLCASMEKQRASFGCGVLDGKIYVFGGLDGSDPVTISEVYDPKVDTWSRIAPPKSYREFHQVITVGKMFCMHGFSVRNANCFGEQEERVFNPIIWNRFDSDDYFSNLLEQSPDAASWEVYHPAKDLWKVMEPPIVDVPTQDFGRLFMAQGQIYTVSEVGIHLLEFDKWTLRGSFSYDGLGPRDPVKIWPIASLAVGDEILAIVYCHRKACRKGEFLLLRSRGFGSKDKEIEWQILLCPFKFGDNSSMSLVQL